MSKLSDLDTLPWYRQFWPWFLIALPASIVVAGIAMVFVAFENADTLVNDNYYREGMAINRVLEQDHKARELGLSAELVIDQQTGEILVKVTGQLTANGPLTLLLLHPTDEKETSSWNSVP
ncbi:MAG: FixH family protein [Porticoccaceae bacterium]